MRHWFGFFVAAIFAAITAVLLNLGERFSALLDMIYPYVLRNYQSTLAQWASGVSYPLWQMLAVVLGVLALCGLLLTVLLKGSPVGYVGWLAAAASGIYLLHTLLWGLNYYSGPLAEDLRLDVNQYTLEELMTATRYYRDKANKLSDAIPRDASGAPEYPPFDQLAEMAGEGFRVLTYEKHYPVFAGSRLPVKELGWADMYSSMGITGVTFGITGEACVNPQIPVTDLPFTMCHEMAHRMCIASERDANFAAFLACSANPSIEFQYSGYFMAFRYCYNALRGVAHPQAISAANELLQGVGANLQADIHRYDSFYMSKKSEAATKIADTANDTYLKTSGEKAGVASYNQVCDLLVNWHIQTVVLPTITVKENPFDPYDETQVDLSGIVNAR